MYQYHWIQVLWLNEAEAFGLSNLTKYKLATNNKKCMFHVILTCLVWFGLNQLIKRRALWAKKWHTLLSIFQKEQELHQKLCLPEFIFFGLVCIGFESNPLVSDQCVACHTKAVCTEPVCLATPALALSLSLSRLYFPPSNSMYLSHSAWLYFSGVVSVVQQLSARWRHFPGNHCQPSSAAARGLERARRKCYLQSLCFPMQSWHWYDLCLRWWWWWLPWCFICQYD